MFNITRTAVLNALAKHIGEGSGASITALTREIAGVIPASWTEGSERCVRKIIEDLRREGEHICAHPSTGYYMAATAEELDDTCQFLYDRAMTSLTQIAAMKKVSLPDLRGQLHLKT